MPGLCGLVAPHKNMPLPELAPMVSTLAYERATVIESYQDEGIAMGCAHLGTGGQQALYQSSQVAVLFFGYLTHPSIPPGADGSDPAAAAHYIHDLYLARGETLTKEIAGTFAFVLWDRQAHALYLMNDHLGMRPIYYVVHNGIFRFASEVKALLADPSLPHRLDRTAVAEFFYVGEVMGNHTFFEDIQLLPPASVLRLQNQQWTVSNYWDIVYPSSYPARSADDYSHQIYEAIQGAVSRMVRSNLRYGVSLSGGLDSRWIAACLAKIRPDSLAFTVGDPEADDVLVAQQVASQLGLTHYCLDMPYTYISDHAETLMYILDGMYSLFNTEEFPLTLRVGDYVDVSVGGLLGGTLFGYATNPVSITLRKEGAMKYFLWRKKGECLPAPLMARVFGKQSQREFEARAMSSLQDAIASVPVERGFHVLRHISLRHRQRRVTGFAQLSKLPYVEEYQPLADKQVFQAGFALPASQLMVKRAYRRALAKYFPETGAIPWSFVMQPPTISTLGAVVYKASQVWLGRRLKNTPLGNLPLFRPLRGFVTFYPEIRGALRGFIEETLLSPEANATGLFDPNGLRDVIRDHMEGQIDVTSFLGQALAIALWTRLFYLPSTPIRPGSVAAPVTVSG